MTAPKSKVRLPVRRRLNPSTRSVCSPGGNHDRNETDDQWPRAPDFEGSSRSDHKPAQVEFTPKDSLCRGCALPAQLRLDPDPLSLQSAARLAPNSRATL